MQQGPPQIPPNPEKIEFKIPNPGDEYTIKDSTGERISSVATSFQRVILAGESSIITLQELGNYFFVYGIYVDPELRKRGIGSQLFEEALKLAKMEKKRGLISSREDRGGRHSDEHGSEGIWQRLKSEGRTTTVTIKDQVYDVLLC